jgi:uncharacterized protein (TIGR00661 family)
MKFLFVVQGEGRGHLTQSLALQKMLVKNGHEVVAVLVGKSNHRELPLFFLKNTDAPVFRFNSPNFLPVAKNKKTNIWISIGYNLLKVPYYIRSIAFIRNKIKETQADVVVNFYDLMLGLTYAVFPPKTPSISIAHQYLFLHPEYQFPAENKTELKMLKFFTRVTCIKSSKLFALSIREKKSVQASRIVVVPPLLREELFGYIPTNGNYLHGYMLNAHYADEIIEYQKQHPEVNLHFFWDKKDVPEEVVVNDRLTFHKLDDKLFLQYMSGCTGYATTAGFESVCEAMYLGKPVLMVPTHIEQSCNAFESAQAGVGIVSDRFDLDALIAYLPEYRENKAFKTWIRQSEQHWMKAFEFEKKELLKQRLSYRFIFGYDGSR